MIVAGIDVGKANLDVSVSEGPVIRFDNTVEGISKLLQHLAEQDATVAVCESTGGYERLVVDRLRKTGIHMHLAQPTRVRAFARVCGYQAKTDPGMPRFCPVSAACSRSMMQENDSGTGTRGVAGLAAPASAACRTAGTRVGESRQGGFTGRCRIPQPPHRLA